jgi:hypothetical protein
VDPHESGGSRRLFTADIGRIKTTYTLTARAFVRLIRQWIETRRDPSLYIAPGPTGSSSSNCHTSSRDSRDPVRPR